MLQLYPLPILRRALLVIVATAALATTLPSFARQADGVLEGAVVRVTDGDTFQMRDSSGKIHKIRIQGVDAPEASPNNAKKAGGCVKPDQPFGVEARKGLESVLAGKQVAVEVTGKSYDRLLGNVRVGDRSVNLVMVEQGWAWYAREYARDQTLEMNQAFDIAEQKARAANRGLWANVGAIKPGDWRKRMANVCVQQ